MILSYKQTLAFIDMYRHRPILWDFTQNDYKNKIKRHDMLMEIAVSFGINEVEVEKKIKNSQRTGNGINEK